MASRFDRSWFSRPKSARPGRPISLLPATGGAFATILLFAGLAVLSATRLSAVNGDWNVNASGNWSDPTQWSSNPDVPGGDGSSVNLTFDITANRIVTIDTTSRTVGQLTIGDPNDTHGYTLAASGGAGLVFQNLGNASQLSFTSTARAGTISAPISLADSLVISNDSANLQTISSTLSASSSGLKTIEIAGSGSGLVYMTAAISDGSGQIGLKINNTGGGGIWSNANNTFSGRVDLISGRLVLGLNAIMGSSASTLNITGGTIESNSTAPRNIGGNATLNGTVSMGNGTNTGAINFNNGASQIALLGNSTINTISTATISHDVTGMYSLTKTGSGILTMLATAKSFSGGFILEDGTVRVGFNDALGTGTITLNSGTIATSTSTSRTLSNALSLGEALTIGETSIGTGTLTFSGPATLTTNSTLTTAVATTFSGAIGGDYGLTKEGSSTLTLSGSNTFTGPVEINTGNLTISGGNAIADHGVVILADAAGVGFNVTASETIGSLQGGGFTGGLVTISTSRLLTVAETGTETFSGVIAGAGGVVKSGSGTWVVGGSNTYTGSTTINEGVLSISNIANGGVDSSTGASATSASNLVLAGGTLRYTGATSSTDRNFTLANGTASAIDVTEAGTVLTISGTTPTSSGAASSLEKLGAGTLALGSSLRITGGLIIQSGTVTALTAASLGVGGNTASFGATGMGTINLERAATTFTNSLDASTGNGTILINPAASGAGVTHTIGATTLGGDRVLTVEGGANVASGTARLNTGGVTLTGNTTLNVLNPVAAETASIFSLGALSDDGTARSVQKTGDGTLLLSAAADALSVGTQFLVNSGTLQVGIAGALASSTSANATTVTVVSGGELRSDVASSFKSSGAGTPDQSIVLDGGALRLAVNGNVDFGGNLEFRPGSSVILDRTASGSGRTYTMGSLLLSGGTLAPETINFTGFPGLVFGSTRVEANSTVDASAAAMIFGDLDVVGSELTLAGSRAYTLNATTVTGDSTIRSTASAVGTLSSGITGSGNLTLANDSATANGITISTISANHTGLIINSGTGSGSVLISSVIGANVTGVLQNSTTSTLTLSGANTYTGTTTVNAGTLALGLNQTMGAIAGAGNLSLSTFTLTTNSSSDTTFSGAISGTGALTKNGTGALTLSGTNTYSGATTINAGTLVLSGTNTSSAITINSGATLAGTGSGGATTVNSGSRISPGGSSVGTLATSTLTLNGGGGYTFSIDNVAGSAGTNWDLINVGSGSGTVTINSSSGSPFTIYLTGNPTGWSDSGTYSWDIISSSDLSGFAVDKFAVDLGGFSPTPTGSFFFSNSGTALVLNYAILGDSIWSGGTGNWDTGFSPPITSNTDVFFAGAGGTATNNIDSGDLNTLGTITFNASASSYTLAANSGSAGASATPLTLVGAIVNESASSQTLDLAMTFNADRVVDTASGNISIGGVISGAGGLTKNGSHTLTLSGTNTFTGAVQINNGTLATTVADALSNSADVTVASGATYSHSGGNNVIRTLNATGSVLINSGTLTIGGNTSSTVSGQISGNGLLTLNGTGSLTLTNSANNYSGQTTINRGTLIVGHDNALGTGTLRFVYAAATTFRSTDASDRIFSNTLGGLSGSGWNVNFGTADTGNLVFSSTTATSLGTGIRIFTVNNAATTFAMAFSSSGGITKAGTGTMILTGNSIYTGNTTINAGTLQLGNGDTTGALSASSAINNNATLAFNRSNTVTQGTDFSNTLGGSGVVVQNGSGSLILNAANTYSGGTTLNSGTLRLDHTGAAGAGTLTQSSGASLLHLNAAGTFANAMSVYNVKASGVITLSGGITVNNATFDVDNGDTLTISGGIGGSGGVTKNGAGSLVLSGSNTYSGATTVNAGTLNAAHANSLGSNTTINVNGGSLLVTADSAIDGKNITLNSTATGNGTAASLVFSGTYNGTAGSLTLHEDSIIDLGTGGVVVHFADLVMGIYNLSIFNWTGTTLWGGTDRNNTDQFYVNRTLGAGELDRISFFSGIDNSSFVGTGFQIMGGDFANQIIPVPEPETWATAFLLLLAGAGWLWKQQRQGKRPSDA